MKYAHYIQQGEQDCGCAAMCTLLKGNGYNVNLSKFNSKYYDGLMGINIRKMCSILSDFNIKVKLFKVNQDGVEDIINNFDVLTLPCLALIRENSDVNHYVVISKATKRTLTISDSNDFFLKKVSKIDFLKKTLFILDTDFSNCKINTSLLNTKENQFLRFIFKSQKMFLVILLFSIIITILSLFSSFYFGWVVNTSLRLNRINILYKLTELFLGVAIIQITLNYIKNLLIIKITMSFQYRIANVFQGKILNSNFQDFSKYSIGEYTSRLNDSLSALSLMTEMIINIIVNIIYIGLSMVVITFIGREILALSVLMLLLFSINILIFFRKIYLLNRQLMENEALFNSSIIQVMENLMSVKTLSVYERVGKSLKNNLIKLVESNRLLSKKTVKSVSLQQAIILIGNVGIIFLGSLLIIEGKSNIGNMTIVFSIMSFLISSANSFYSEQSNLQKLAVSLSRLRFILDFPNEKNSGCILNTKITSIKLKSFCLKSREKTLLEKINIKINIGKKPIVIIGKSGVGKSLLFKTILKLFSDYEGEILVNDLNIRTINPYNLRKKILYVSNSDKLIKGTFKDNIDLFGQYDENQLKKYIAMFGLDSLFETLPNRFEQEINPDQAIFSVGQLQRITILRALLCNPEILILDEAISNIDKKNVYRIVKYLNDLDIQTIYISHQKIPVIDPVVINFEDKSLKISRKITND